MNGDTTFVNTISLAPTDSTFLFETSCSPLDTGLVINPMQNQFGCDSLIITYTSLLASQNIMFESTTCDPMEVGVFQDSLQNQFGCDSIITNTITFAPTVVDSLISTSCFLSEIGTDTIFVGTTSLGCDSIVVEVVEFDQVIEMFVSINDISCFGDSDGFIRIDSVVGGTPPYMYSLDFEPLQSNPIFGNLTANDYTCLLYTSPSPRDATLSRMPSSA